jgi:ketosteroid isomerase-like protein
VAKVLRAFDDLDRATEGRDAEAIVRLFVDDSDVTFFGSAVSEQAVGPSELRTLAELIAGAPGSFVVDWEERRVSIHRGVAWLNATGTARWDRGDGDVQVMPYRATAILVHRGGLWLLHTFNGSEPQPQWCHDSLL